MPDDQQKAGRSEPGIDQYKHICLAALAVILLILLRRKFGFYSFFPVGVGLIGLATRWVSAPAVLLLSLAACLHSQSGIWAKVTRDAKVPLPDLVLCAAALAYVIAHFRLQSLAVHIFPRDPRRDEARPGWRIGALQLTWTKPVGQRRPARLVSSHEIGALILSLPAWAAWSLVCWKLLTIERGNPGLDAGLWRCMIIAWTIGVGSLIVVSVVGYWERRQMSCPEALLLLQDAFWQETRSAQRRIERGVAWARLRSGRRKEPT